MSNEYRKSNYHRRKKELFTHYEILLDLIHEGKIDDDKREKDFVNITYLRERLPKLYSKDDRTGLLNSRNIGDTITTMDKIGLITREKRGKQKKIIKLTTLGDDIYLFIHNLENYNQSYFNLLDSLTEKLLFIPGSHLGLMNFVDKQFNTDELVKLKEDITNFKKQLERDGWIKIEVYRYNEIRSNLIDFKVVCDRTFLNVVLLRYAKIREKYQFADSLILRFLGHLIKVSIEKKVDFMLRNFDKEISGFSRIRIISPLNADLIREFDLIQAGMGMEERLYPKLNECVSSRETTGGESEYFVAMSKIFYNNIISFSFREEIEEMIKSYLDLLQIHLGNYDEYLDGTKQIILDIQTELESNPKLSISIKETLSLIMKTAKFFLNILLDYAKRNKMQITTFNPL